jgi:hypothetical protein
MKHGTSADVGTREQRGATARGPSIALFPI